MREVQEQTVPAARPVFPAEDRERIAAMIVESLATGSLTLGPLTRRFEASVAARVGAPFAVAVSSGTAALEIVLRHVGVDGREVVVPANTFFATAAAVLHAGGTPRFADIDPQTLALSPESVEPALTKNTAAVVLVHIGGVVTPDVQRLRDLCDSRGIALLEDAAHAHGAGFDGKHAGTFGRAGTFSFYPTKVVASGEGGMIVTDDERLRDDAVVYRDQGKAGFLGGEHTRLGYAWRMSELHAAVGLTQWERLDEFVANRRRAAAIYDEMLAGTPGVTPLEVPRGCEPNYYKYVAMLDGVIDRDALKRELREGSGVSLSGEVYARPLHHEPVFAYLAQGPFPVAEDVCRRQICLPVHSDMTAAEARHVAESLAATVGRMLRDEPLRDRA
ncbi:MAG: aminotransferase DegT [Actinomycetia bacterium]|nr:aminotransferase DegT [Actinomycetes bacterium]